MSDAIVTTYYFGAKIQRLCHKVPDYIHTHKVYINMWVSIHKGEFENLLKEIPQTYILPS